MTWEALSGKHPDCLIVRVRISLELYAKRDLKDLMLLKLNATRKNAGRNERIHRTA